MRFALAVVAAGLGAVIVLLALAAVNLRVFIDAHRDELVADGARALGRNVTIGTVRPSWWPIGIRFTDVTVGDDARFATTPFVAADAVRIVLRANALVRGRAEVSRIVVERPHIRLVRDARGRWNVASLGAAPEGNGTAPGEEGEGRGRRSHRVRMRLPLLGLAASEIRDG